MRASIPLSLLVVMASAPEPAVAAVSDYDTCVSRATVEPEQTVRDAIAWRRASGAAAALHCEAIALVELGATKTAAERLTELANEPGLAEEARVSVLSQAANLWLEIGERETARIALDAAVGIKSTPAILIERAALRAGERDWTGARVDLDDAVRREPGNVEALTLRASVKRRLGDLNGAKQDVLQALELQPEDAAAWLELGMVERALGANDGARRSWLKAIDVEPGGPSAALARGALQDMDGGG